MRILILGGDGMLGHQLMKHLSANGHDVKVTLRQPLAAYREFHLFHPENAFAGIDVRCLDGIAEVFGHWQPQAVVNAVGIVKQRPSSKELMPSVEINALFPHKLAALCRIAGIHMVHMSTDCIFAGKRGNYREEDPSDAEDLYGKTKYLGEVHDSPCLTIRTSIIGKELWRKQGLLEWFLAQQGKVDGFTNAIFSGFTTKELSSIIEKILLDHKGRSGLYHISSDPISKYDLLLLIKDKMKLEIEITPTENPWCDRSLDSTKFRREFNYTPPSWMQMIEELGETSK
jgi:dTDP-4-dehydrorhamnose reductase